MKKLIVSILITVLIICAFSPGVYALTGEDDMSYAWPEADVPEGTDTSKPYDPLIDNAVNDPESMHSGGENTRLMMLRSVFATANTSYPRILLSTSRSSVNVTFYGSYCLYDVSGTAIFLPISGSTYTLSYSDSKVTFSYAGTPIYSGTGFTVEEHTPPAGMSYNYFSLNNSAYNAVLSYRGDLIARPVNKSEAGLFLINRVYIEDYVLGVIPYEIGESYGVEALKAQAVAARNYAYKSIYGTNTFDLYDTSRSQVYRGIPSSVPNSAAAVEATSKMMVTYLGAPISLYYGASNGGVVEIPSHPWTDPTVNPWNEIKADEYDLRYGQADASKFYLREITVPKDSLDSAGMLKAMIKNVYSLTDDEANTVSLTSVTLSADCADEKHRAAYEAERGTGAYFCTHFSTLTATVSGSFTQNGSTVTLDSQAINVSDTALSGLIPSFKSTETLRCFWLIDNGTSYTVRQGRYGHGIGMSQTGARQMAAEGKTYDFILGFYFPNTQISSSAGIAERTALTSQPALGTTPMPAVNDGYVYMRANDASLTLGIVKAGTTQNVTGTSGDFYTVSFAGQTGYVKSSCFTQTYSSVRIQNVTTSCNVRSEPSSSGGSATVIGSAPLNAVYTLIAQNAAAGWHEVNYNGRTAYISASYAIPVPDAALTIGEYSVTVSVPEGYSDNIVWVDGIKTTAARSGQNLTFTVYGNGAKTVSAFKNRATGTPEQMYAWTLAFSGSAYTATALPSDMQDLLSYHGCAVRYTGKTGLRFISGISELQRAALLSSGIDGYTLKEYGTVVISAASIPAYPFTKGGVATRFGRSYWDAENDYQVKVQSGRIWFASVLIDLQSSMYDHTYGFRPYAIIKKGGVEYTVYGAPVERSMYYVCKQVLSGTEFAAGSDGYNFIDAIVKSVEGK